MNKAEFMRLIIFEKVVLSKTVRQEKLCVLALINASIESVFLVR